MPSTAASLSPANMSTRHRGMCVKRRRAPEFEALMADARRRRFDCVLVWKYDRFARPLGALIAALQEFRDLGVDFISHTQAIDTTTPMGRLFFHVIGSFAEFERDVIVERVKAGLANARAKGKRLGRPCVMIWHESLPPPNRLLNRGSRLKIGLRRKTL